MSMNEWLEYYELAKNYYEYYGNLFIKARFKTNDGINYSENGKKLGNWLKRETYKVKHRTYDKNKRELLDKIGFVIDKKEIILNKIWMEKYDLAKNYFNYYHNLKINHDFITNDGITYDEKGKKIGEWLSHQKISYKNNILDKDKIKMLEKINIEWYSFEIKFNEYYELAKNYYEYYGNLDINRQFNTNDGITYKENGIKLGNWIYNLRRAHLDKTKMNLTKERIEKLNNIGMIWNKNEYIDEKWLNNFELSKNYYEYYGNLEIPYNYKTKDGVNFDEEGINLGSWINKQRCSKLLDEQIDLLNSIHINWNCESKISSNWIQCFNLAKKYYEYNHDLFISSAFKTKDGINYNEEGINLGFWLITQRRVYNRTKEGNITDIQIEMLNKIGMKWDSFDNKLKRELMLKKCDEKWDKNFDLYNNFFNYYNTLDVPRYFKSDDGINYNPYAFNLYAWVKNQEKNYSNLSKKQQELLDNIKELDNNKEIDILKKFKLFLTKYDSNSLPSKDKINKEFIKKL